MQNPIKGKPHAWKPLDAAQTVTESVQVDHAVSVWWDRVKWRCSDSKGLLFTAFLGLAIFTVQEPLYKLLYIHCACSRTPDMWSTCLLEQRTVGLQRCVLKLTPMVCINNLKHLLSFLVAVACKK